MFPLSIIIAWWRVTSRLVKVITLFPTRIGLPDKVESYIKKRARACACPSRFGPNKYHSSLECRYPLDLTSKLKELCFLEHVSESNFQKNLLWHIGACKDVIYTLWRVGWWGNVWTYILWHVSNKIVLIFFFLLKVSMGIDPWLFCRYHCVDR